MATTGHTKNGRVALPASALSMGWLQRLEKRALSTRKRYTDHFPASRESEYPDGYCGHR